MASSAKFCSQCASPLPEPNPPFCSQCGAAVTGQAIESPPPPADVNVTNDPLPVTVNPSPRPRFDPTTAVIGALIGAYLLIGFMIVYEFFDALRTLFNILLVLNVLPPIIGLIRNKHNKLAIFLINLLLGWTFIGWVIALVWACSGDRDD